MTHPVDLKVLELMAARMCHDLIGPVSAIGQGVELVADEEPSFIREAVALVGDSARSASHRLQFYRFAYGFRGTGISSGSPQQLVAEYFEGGNIDCEYGADMRERPLPDQKLACVMLSIAAECLPRGGRLVLSAGDPGPEIAAAGLGHGPTPEMLDALELKTQVDELTPRTVGAYFAGLLADRLDWRLDTKTQPGGFRLAAISR